jgi:pyruvate dehydrogenase (quinone)
MSTTIAAALVSILEKAGVSRIHGIVGDSLNAITDEVRKSKTIEWVHYRHEEAAAFAASAEAQLTGKLAVCAGSCGPGNLHLINGLYDAHRSMAPVLAIAAHIPSSEIGTGYFQETHPELLFRECSHYCEIISSSRQMPRVLQIAMQYAISLRGVSVIGLSGDVAEEKVDWPELRNDLLLNRSSVRPCDTELQQLASLINQAARVTLLCGSGCAGAHGVILQLAEKIGSPVVHSLRGKEHVEHDNPFDVGMTGLIGHSSGYHAMKDSDLLVMLGTDFPYKDWYPEDAKIVQLDLRPERLGRRCRLEMGLSGDVRETLQALLPLLEKKSSNAHLTKSLNRYAASRERLEAHAKGKEGVQPIHPEYLTKLVSDTAVDNAIYTADVGAPTVWAARYLKMRREQRLIGSFNHGSMAAALPMAIGAQLTYPGRQVIALCGDGGFAMMMGDILTILQYNLPVKLVLYNNSSLGFVAMEMKVAGLQPFGTDLKNPNFARMATSMGIPGIRVENPEEIQPALKKAFSHPGPALIDVVVNPSELTLPPSINFKEAKGFSIYMLKQVLAGEGAEVWQTLSTNFLNK